jgi:hypothetical protein
MGWLQDLLQGVEISLLLRKQIAIAEQRFTELEAENKRLQEDLARLATENNALKSGVAEQEVRYVELRGVLWKKELDGVYLPCCPICKISLTKTPPWAPDFLHCSRCKFHASFHPNEIDRITKNLPT